MLIENWRKLVHRLWVIRVLLFLLGFEVVGLVVQLVGELHSDLRVRIFFSVGGILFALAAMLARLLVQNDLKEIRWQDLAQNNGQE